MKQIPDTGWGSHKPLLQALIDVFAPYFIMELGIGIHSTPILSKKCTKYVGVEQDYKWIEKMLNFPDFQFVKIIHHASDIKIGQRFDDLTINQIDGLIGFYTMLKNSVIELSQGEYSMLFVDNYPGCRTLAINTMFDAFDIICYHDSEAVDWYNYNFDENLKNNYNHYTLTTDIVGTRDIVGTSVFIKKELKELSAELKHIVRQYVEKYAEENNMDENLITFKQD
jgi:hypothetical protein